MAKRCAEGPFGAYFPKSRGKPCVDDRPVLSGIIFINRNGLRQGDAPKEYDSHKTLYNRQKRWSEKGIFAQIMMGLAAEHVEEKTVILDATHLKAHRTAASMGVKKRGRGRLIGRTRGGMNTKLHSVCDSQGRPINLFVTVGQISDYIGARALLSGSPRVEWLVEDRGYDADWFRDLPLSNRSRRNRHILVVSRDSGF